MVYNTKRGLIISLFSEDRVARTLFVEERILFADYPRRLS